ncbi:MAG TPA: copper resistance protein NlpE N-terminal domain-containing protein [Rhodanobacteraceae bacterium]|nr:copper resistance protein NlpE N-terminal domain-containing protein [Rhodanobacteraceae bacterium]
MLRQALVLLSLIALTACQKSPAPSSAPAAPASSGNSGITQPVQPAVSSAPLLQSQHAFFTGQLPCDACSSEKARLVLQRDELGRNSYVLKETQVRDGQTSAPVETGSWQLQADRAGEPPIALLTLDSGRPGAKRRFSVAYDGSLDSLDSDLPRALKRESGDLDLRALFNAQLLPSKTP